MKKGLFTLIICGILLIPVKSSATVPKAATIVINADTKEIISGNHYKTPMKIASTTKIMTAIIAMENASSSDIFTVSANAQNQEGSSVYLRAGQKIHLRELLYALMLNSGNDAAMAIAENVANSSEEFVKMMNEKAKDIGCKNTNFENPSGLPAENHYSTAYDMSIIMAYAMKNDFFREIVVQKEYQIKNNSDVTYLRNHNKLLWLYPYCIGGKTGFTKESGRCLVTASSKDEKNIVCVTLNCSDDWQQHISMSEKAFEKISRVKIIEKNNIITTKKINSPPVNLIADSDVTVTLSDKNENSLLCKIFLNENF